MSPGEVRCNGYGQMRFGYLITQSKKTEALFAFGNCCLFRGASDDLWLKSGHYD